MWQSTRTETGLGCSPAMVNASNPLITERPHAPSARAPSAPTPANPDNPTAAEGAYTLDDAGNVDALHASATSGRTAASSDRSVPTRSSRRSACCFAQTALLGDTALCTRRCASGVRAARRIR